jgi:hypothetical protein
MIIDLPVCKIHIVFLQSLPIVNAFKRTQGHTDKWKDFIISTAQMLYEECIIIKFFSLGVTTHCGFAFTAL